MLAEMWVTGSDPGSGYPEMTGVKSENISLSCPPFWVNNIFLQNIKYISYIGTRKNLEWEDLTQVIFLNSSMKLRESH